MVIVHNLNPPPNSPDSNTSPALRGYDADLSISDFDFSYNHIKMTICSKTMDYCSATIKRDRVCNIPGRCNSFYKTLIVPSNKYLCSVANNACDDGELDDKLKSLYAAEAITDNPEYSKKIDMQIKELNDLKHKAKIVSASLDLERSRRSRAKYLEEKKKYEESESNIDHPDKDIETEEVYV